MKNVLTASLILVCSFQSVRAGGFFESEPNNTEATANNVNGIESSDFIRGQLNSNDVDYFRVTPTATSFGLYRNQFQYIGLYPYYSQFLEGQRFSNSVSTYYTFGNGSSVLLNTMMEEFGQFTDYLITYTRAAITPTNLGTFQQGNFRFQEHNTGVDFGTLDLQIFDSQGRVVPDAWDQNPDRIVFFDFSANLAPGIYYALAGASIRSTVTNTPNAVLGEGNVMATNVIGAQSVNTATIQITTPTSSVSLTDVGHRLSTGPDYIVPYTFTVVPEPTSLLTLGAGIAMLGRKRWRR